MTKPIIQKDLKGNITYSRNSNGYEAWYDSNGNMTHLRDSSGYETWYEYDSNGNLTHYKTSSGYERWYEYDSNGNMTHYKTSSGYEQWNEYDSSGNRTHYRTSSGYERWYDSSGKLIENPNIMQTSKEQLKTKIQELESQLRTFKEELENSKPKTIRDAEPGDVLEDGSIVIKKADGLALVVAPKCTEVKCSWSKEFTDVFEFLTCHGFIVSQWFVPTLKQLALAFEVIPDEFHGGEFDNYWGSGDHSKTFAGCIARNPHAASWNRSGKHISHYVRAFRCISY